MRLATTLGVRRGDVVAFVGAGGKTTTMFTLARELVDQGWRVLTTTTTMIAPPRPEDGTVLALSPDENQAHRLVELALSDNSHVTLATQLLPEQNKLRGVPPNWIPGLSSLVDAVLVEADGSRMRPFKAPAAHEPVVPPNTSLLIPVAGIDAIGKPLGPETTHRPERISALTGLPLGAEITPRVMAQVMAHSDGGRKGFAGDRVVPLVNKVQLPQDLDSARDIAQQLMSSPTVDRVVIGAVAQGQIAECWRRVAAVVLAAGGSSRMGTPKQLLTYSGEPILTRVLRNTLSVPFDQVTVVLGAHSAELLPLVPASCRAVVNQHWQEGISSSLRAGLDNVSARAEAAMFIPSDQPLLGPDTLLQILYAFFGTEKGIIVPEYRGQRGTPVLFERRLFPRLRQIRGDTGGREVIHEMPEEVLSVEIRSADALLDIDTMQDYQDLITTR